MTLAVDIIKEAEGLRLKSYLDRAGVWTIGWGHTRDVVYGMEVTAAQAEEFLREDMSWVLTLIEDTVKGPLTVNQHAAVASLIYNIGEGQWRTSTALRRLNAGNFAGAAEAMTWFNKIHRNGVLQVSNGLVKRRERERTLFLAISTIGLASSRGAVYGGEAKLMHQSKTQWFGLGGVLTTGLAAWGQMRNDAPELVMWALPYLPYIFGMIFAAVMFNRWIDSRRGVH